MRKAKQTKGKRKQKLPTETTSAQANKKSSEKTHKAKNKQNQ